MVGLRVQTTHVASIKRKYTVWGVSSQSAERREFDVEDETTGRRTKTTVAAYFRDRYNIRLRYANSFYRAESTLYFPVVTRDGCIFLLSHRAETIGRKKLISFSIPSLGVLILWSSWGLNSISSVYCHWSGVSVDCVHQFSFSFLCLSWVPQQ